MINKKVISKEQALYAVENGEFSSDVISSKNRVIIIMTQDWCPQWHDMQRWIFDLRADEDIDIYQLIYNKTDFAQAFMDLKEGQWKNENIPYLRYYKEGKLVKQTNYVRMQELLKGLEL